MYNITQHHIHFIGCDKLYVAGLALLLNKQGVTVSGSSSAAPSYMTQKLSDRGVHIFYEYHAKHITPATIVVVGPHITSKNSELTAARVQNKIVITYATLLAELVKQYNTIATIGTYGTTMITALIGYILHRAEYAPTILARGIMCNARSSAMLGTSNWAVVDSKYALETIQPAIGVFTNLCANIKETESHAVSPLQPYLNLLKQLPFYGTAVLNYDDAITYSLRKKWHGHCITYGLGAHAHIRGHIVSSQAMASVFNVTNQDGRLLGSVTLPLPGSSNVRHALGAIAVCHQLLGIPFNEIKHALKKFSGVKRSFEHIGTVRHTMIIDHRAWHPDAVHDALIQARALKSRSLHIIFQLPFESLAREYWSQFISLFVKHSTHISTVHIAPTSEFLCNEKTSIDQHDFATDLSDATQNISLFCYQDFDEVVDSVHAIIQPEDTVVVLGPDSIAQLSDKVVR